MERVVPVLPIDDYQEACDFYVTGLGFSIDFEHRHEPGFPVHMGIGAGNLYLHLSEHGRGHQGSDVYIFIDDVQAWYDRCQSGGIDTAGPPKPMPWGNTELMITDPFRNTLRFTQIGTHSGTASPVFSPGICCEDVRTFLDCVAPSDWILSVLETRLRSKRTARLASNALTPSRDDTW